MTLPTDSALTAPRRIDSWGRMHREAVALDPKTGIVYMTEDRADGCFYRHVPVKKDEPLGPGKVQALAIEGVPNSSPYPQPDGQKLGPPKWPNGHRWRTTWVDIPDPHAKTDSCRAQGLEKGATAFMRGEGIVWSGTSVWFTASLGGAAWAGQIFEFIPDGGDTGTGQLVMHLEVEDRSVVSCPDNLIMTPTGDLLMAEDNYAMGPGCTHQHLRIMNRKGQIYDLARNRIIFQRKAERALSLQGLAFRLTVSSSSSMSRTQRMSPWP